MDLSPLLNVKEISPKEKIDLVISPSMLQISKSKLSRLHFGEPDVSYAHFWFLFSDMSMYEI